jgi:hypothetical protein
MSLSTQDRERLAVLLRAELVKSNFYAPDGNELLETHIEVAFDSFADDTGQISLIAATVPAVRTFGARNGLISFSEPLARFDELKIDGEVIENENGLVFNLGPAQKPVHWPSYFLLLNAAHSLPRGAVEVKGLWGCFITLPRRVELAIVQKAALTYASTLGFNPPETAQAGQVKRRKDEDIEIEMFSGAEGKTAELMLSSKASVLAGYRTFYEAAVEAYRRF